MPIDESNPRWLREVALALPASPQLILTGNVRDHHFVGGDVRRRIHELDPLVSATQLDTVACLAAVLALEGVPVTMLYDPVDGLRQVRHGAGVGPAGADVQDARTSDETLKSLVESASGTTRSSIEEALNGAAQPHTNQAEEVLGHILRFAVQDPKHRMALILDFASWMTPVDNDTRTGSDRATELPKLLRHAAKAASTAQPYKDGRTTSYNPIIWITRQQADLPSWLVTAPGMDLVSIELPSAHTRDDYGRLLLEGSWPRWRDLPADEQDSLVRRFATATEGLTLKDGSNIVNLARSLDPKPSWTAQDRLHAAEQVFRIGVPESQWDNPDLLRYLAGAGGEPDCLARLNKRVTGQEQATRKAADVLMRSAVGLSGAESHSTSTTRPKGVLFLAGPTGTGKTLMARTIAGLLTLDDGNTDAYLRFDMSEYSAEHMDARLVGAPPGYVGYDAGGQLTEAVRQRPFSVLLFDEIEKAHPRILDKFLQVLDEGRLTDGTGRTVSFAETFIVFTSNLGVTDIRRDEQGTLIAEAGFTYEGWQAANERVPGSGYAELERHTRSSVTRFFTETILRPELLNRIGTNNVVIFDYISDESAAVIVDTGVTGVVDRMLERHGCRLTFTPAALGELHAVVLRADYLGMGGRGLNSGIENHLINPLAKEFGHLVARTGGTPSVVDVTAVHPNLEVR
jgi:ATP-dependent Clp protease ATP-binding subunit ClpB